MLELMLLEIDFWELNKIIDMPVSSPVGSFVGQLASLVSWPVSRKKGKLPPVRIICYSANKFFVDLLTT